MSLNSAGLRFKITDSEYNKLGYGHVNHNDPSAAADALRLAVEEFIKTDQFKQLTTTSLSSDMKLNLDFLVITTMT